MFHRTLFSRLAQIGLIVIGLAAPAAGQTPTATLAIEVRDASDAVTSGITASLASR